MGIERAIAIGRMRGALDRGLSFATFFKELQRLKVPTYRRTTMLSDWRAVGELEQKKDLLKYVRKDYYPTERSIAQNPWKLSREYMYKVRVESRLRPDEPLVSRFVNIMSDDPMTPRMIEQAVVEKWREWEKYMDETIEVIAPTTAIHRTVE